MAVEKTPVNKPAQIDRKQKIVRPEGEKPAGFVEVQFKYIGQNKKMKDKIFISYVSPEIAKLYKEPKDKNRDNILKIG
jgi:hypothetical protein